MFPLPPGVYTEVTSNMMETDVLDKRDLKIRKYIPNKDILIHSVINPNNQYLKSVKVKRFLFYSYELKRSINLKDLIVEEENIMSEMNRERLSIIEEESKSSSPSLSSYSFLEKNKNLPSIPSSPKLLSTIPDTNKKLPNLPLTSSSQVDNQNLEVKKEQKQILSKSEITKSKSEPNLREKNRYSDNSSESSNKKSN